MGRYNKLSESELDTFLMISFFPNKKEKLNLSDKELFITTIMEKIINNKLEIEFGENIMELLPPHDKKGKGIGYTLFLLTMEGPALFKRAALKTYDENKEFIK